MNSTDQILQNARLHNAFAFFSSPFLLLSYGNYFRFLQSLSHLHYSHPFMRCYRSKPFFSPTTSTYYPLIHSHFCSTQFSFYHPHNTSAVHLTHKGKTRNPENVEYFQPPIRFPLSSLR